MELIGTASLRLNGIDVYVVRQGKQLSTDATESLVQPITHDEIDVTIKGIDINKTPGLDGFNSFFY